MNQVLIEKKKFLIKERENLLNQINLLNPWSGLKQSIGIRIKLNVIDSELAQLESQIQKAQTPFHFQDHRLVNPAFIH